MDRLLPLEPGCLCLCTDPDLSSPITVTAVEFVGEVTVGDVKLIGDDLWLVDALVPSVDIDDPGDVTEVPFCNELHLLRIDGTPDNVETREEEKVFY